MEAPEKQMMSAFMQLKLTREILVKAKSEYEKRNNSNKADKENAINVGSAISKLDEAYDEISAIWENDLNV